MAAKAPSPAASQHFEVNALFALSSSFVVAVTAAALLAVFLAPGLAMRFRPSGTISDGGAVASSSPARVRSRSIQPTDEALLRTRIWHARTLPATHAHAFAYPHFAVRVDAAAFASATRPRSWLGGIVALRARGWLLSDDEVRHGLNYAQTRPDCLRRENADRSQGSGESYTDASVDKEIPHASTANVRSPRPVYDKAIATLKTLGVNQADVERISSIAVVALPHVLGLGFAPLTVWLCYSHGIKDSARDNLTSKSQHGQYGQYSSEKDVQAEASDAMPARSNVTEGNISTTKTLVYTILEVNNTFGDKHVYLCHKGNEISGPRKGFKFRHVLARSFHVSPFNDRTGYYDAHITDDPFDVLLILRRPDTSGAGAVTQFPCADLAHRLPTKAELDAMPKHLIARIQTTETLELKTGPLLRAVSSMPLAGALTFPRILYHAFILAFKTRTRKAGSKQAVSSVSDGRDGTEKVSSMVLDKCRSVPDGGETKMKGLRVFHRPPPILGTQNVINASLNCTASAAEEDKACKQVSKNLDSSQAPSALQGGTIRWKPMSRFATTGMQWVLHILVTGFAKLAEDPSWLATSLQRQSLFGVKSTSLHHTSLEYDARLQGKTTLDRLRVYVMLPDGRTVHEVCGTGVSHATTTVCVQLRSPLFVLALILDPHPIRALVHTFVRGDWGGAVLTLSENGDRSSGMNAANWRDATPEANSIAFAVVSSAIMAVVRKSSASPLPGGYRFANQCFAGKVYAALFDPFIDTSLDRIATMPISSVVPHPHDCGKLTALLPVLAEVAILRSVTRFVLSPNDVSKRCAAWAVAVQKNSDRSSRPEDAQSTDDNDINALLAAPALYEEHCKWIVAMDTLGCTKREAERGCN